MYSCSEVTKIEAEQPEPPTINDFTPKSGKARTEIKIWGENLSNVNKVTIGDIESGIKYRLTNDTIIVYPLPTSKLVKSNLLMHTVKRKVMKYLRWNIRFQPYPMYRQW